MKIKLVSLLVLGIVLLDCNSEQQQKQQFKNYESINISPSNDTLKFSEYFTNSEVILIKDTILGNILRVYQIGNRLLINTKSGKNRLHIYNLKTGIIKSFLEIGKTPDKFTDSKEVKFEGENIFVLDFMKSRIAKYSLDGIFSNNLTIPNYSQSFEFIDSTKIVLYKEVPISKKKEYLINVYSFSENKIVSHFLRLDPFLYLQRNFVQPTYLYKFNDTIRFFKTFRDTIYNFQNDELCPRFVLNKAKYKLPDDWINNKNWNLQDFVKRCKNSNYVWYIMDLFESNYYIFFSYKYLDNEYTDIYNKKLRENASFKYLYDDIFSKYKGPAINDFMLAGYTADELIFVAEPYWFKETLEKYKASITQDEWQNFIKNNSNIWELYNNLKLTDNQIIIKYKYK